MSFKSAKRRRPTFSTANNSFSSVPTQPRPCSSTCHRTNTNATSEMTLPYKARGGDQPYPGLQRQKESEFGRLLTPELLIERYGTYLQHEATFHSIADRCYLWVKERFAIQRSMSQFSVYERYDSRGT